MGFIFPRDTSIPGGIRAGISPPPARRWRSCPTTARWNSARSTSAAERIIRMLHPVLAAHPALGGVRLRGRRSRRPAEAAARAVSGRGAQQAALGVFHSARADRGVPRRRGFAPGPGGRIRLRPAVPVRADREESCRATATRTCTCSCATTSGSWTARRSRSSATSTSSRSDARFHRAACRATARAVAPPRAAATRPDRVRPHAGRVHGQGGDGARRHAPRRLLRSGAAPDLPHAVFRQGLRAVRARAARQPQPLRISAAIRRGATGGRVAGDVRAGGRPARGDLPHLRHGAAHRRPAAATPTTSASC